MTARHLTGAVLTAGLALTLAACGGGGGGTTPTESGTAGGGSTTAASGELTPVTIGLIPIIDVAPVHVGIDQGFFEEEGLELTIEAGQGGAAIVPGVVSGDMQFGFGNSMSTIIAAGTGVPIQVVASGVYSTGNPEEDAFTVVAADEAIQRPADLEGLTVATNTVNAIGDSVVMRSVELDGGDPSTITFVEMPFPSMNAAVLAGDVDAAWQVEPFYTLAMDEGLHLVTTVLQDIADEFEVATYFANAQYIEDNPETVEAFQRAINRSLKFSQENPDEVRRVLDTYLELPEGLSERVVLPSFREGVSRSTFELYMEMAQERALVQQDVDLDLLLEPAS